MLRVLLVWFASTFLWSVVSSAAEALRDDLVLATLPKSRISGLSMEETIYAMQKKAGHVDHALAVSLALKNIRLGIITDDVRRYGSALAILESVPPQDRRGKDFQRTLADVQSTLHQFDSARATLSHLITDDPQDDTSRRKLFYLELLRGDLLAAAKHCVIKSGFSNPIERSLCSYHVVVASGKTLAAREESIVSDTHTRGSPEMRLWAADIMLDQRFIECLKDEKKRCSRLHSYSKSYLQLIQGEKTRLVYLVDRLLMAGFYKEALSITPESTTNLALASRRLAGLIHHNAVEQWSPGDRALHRFVIDAIRSEADRGSVEHAREAAIVALMVEKSSSRAKDLAILNWTMQREWIDLWLMHQANTFRDDNTISSSIEQWSALQGIFNPFIGAPL
jgi:hypothetical protein